MANNPPPGIRNNNPFNLKKDNEPWQGLADQQTDTNFFQFKTAIYGIRAGARNLITYQDEHQLNTVRLIITRFAPAADNNDTEAYINDVSSRMHIDADAPLNMHQFADLEPLTKAIIQHENGQQPYTDAQITKALVMVGVEPETQSLQQTRTVKGSQLAAASIIGTAVIQGIGDTADPAKSILADLAQYIPQAKWGLLVCALIGIAIVLYARIDDRLKGLR